MITQQEVFGRVWTHFVVEKGAPSLSKKGRHCCYRGDDGAKCAVGLFIPDDCYVGTLEGLDVSYKQVHDALPLEFRDKAGRIPGSLLGLLDDLQQAHDKSAKVESDFHNSMEEWLRLIAARRRLQLPT